METMFSPLIVVYEKLPLLFEDGSTNVNVLSGKYLFVILKFVNVGVMNCWFSITDILEYTVPPAAPPPPLPGGSAGFVDAPPPPPPAPIAHILTELVRAK